MLKKLVLILPFVVAAPVDAASPDDLDHRSCLRTCIRKLVVHRQQGDIAQCTAACNRTRMLLSRHGGYTGAR